MYSVILKSFQERKVRQEINPIKKRLSFNGNTRKFLQDELWVEDDKKE